MCPVVDTLLVRPGDDLFTASGRRSAAVGTQGDAEKIPILPRQAGSDLHRVEPMVRGTPHRREMIRTCMGLFPVKWLFRFIASSLFGAGRAVLHPVAYDHVPGARAMGSRDQNASKAWRLAA